MTERDALILNLEAAEEIAIEEGWGYCSNRKCECRGGIARTIRRAITEIEGYAATAPEDETNRQ